MLVKNVNIEDIDEIQKAAADQAAADAETDLEGIDPEPESEDSLEWAKDYAKIHNKQYIRLDTIGDNTRLIKHYCTCGFNFLGMFELPNVDELPPHYKEGPACLFEIDLAKK